MLRGAQTPASSAVLREPARVADRPTERQPLTAEDLAPGPGAGGAGTSEAERDGGFAAGQEMQGLRLGGGGPEACISEGLARLTVRAKGETAVVNGSLDVGPCLAQSLAREGTEVEVAEETMRFYFRITCDGIDLARFDGRSYGELEGGLSHPCAGARGASALAQTDNVQFARVRLRAPDGSVVTAEEGRRHVQFDGGEGGDACRYELRDGRFVRTHCAVVSRDLITRSRLEKDGQVVTRPDEGRESYHRQVDAPAD